MEENNCTVPSDKNTTPFISSKPEVRFLPQMNQPENLKETVRLENCGHPEIPFRIFKGYTMINASLLKNKCDMNHKCFRRRSLLALLNISVFLVSFICTSIVSAKRIINKLTLLLFVSHILTSQGIEARPTLDQCINDLTNIERPSLETFSALLHQMLPLQDLLKDICHKSPNSWQKLYNQARAIDVLALELQKEILLLLEEENILSSSKLLEAAPINDPAGNGHPALTPPPSRPGGRAELAIEEPLDDAIEEPLDDALEDTSTDICNCDCKSCCPEAADTPIVPPEVIVTAPIQPECPPEQPIEKTPLSEVQPEIADLTLENSEVNSEIIEPLPAPAAVTDNQEVPKEELDPIPVLSVVIIDTMPMPAPEVLNEVNPESTLPPTSTIQMLSTTTPLIQSSTVHVTTAPTTATAVVISNTHLSDIYTTTKTNHQLTTLTPHTPEGDKPPSIIYNNVVNDEPVRSNEDDSYKVYDESTEDSIIKDDEYIVTYADDFSTISPVDMVTDSYDYYYTADNVNDTYIAPDVALPLTVTPMWSDDATSYIIIDYDLDIDAYETTMSSSKTVSSTVVPDQTCFCPCSCSDPDVTSLTSPLKSTLQTIDITKTYNACSMPLFSCYLSVIIIINLFVKFLVLKI